MFLLTADPTGNHYYWIGLTDLFHEGNFIWASSGEKATYTHWYPGEPNNVHNRTEHFVHLFQSTVNRTWNDDENDKHGVFALCQFSL
jgi:hypothetical protein